MPSPWLLPYICGAALLVLVGIGYLVGAGFRTWNLAACWSCGATKVRRSVSHSWLDTLAMVFFLMPYRCAGCRVRFYAFRTSSARENLTLASEAAVPARPRLFPIRVRVIVRLTTGKESPLTVAAFVWAHSRLTLLPRLFSDGLSSDPQ